MIYDFLFQAEDGIRDSSVTGVQTCALPICDLATLLGAVKRVSATRDVRVLIAGETNRARRERVRQMVDAFGLSAVVGIRGERSEERRVGKECGPEGWRDVGRKMMTVVRARQ